MGCRTLQATNEVRTVNMEHSYELTISALIMATLTWLKLDFNQMQILIILMSINLVTSVGKSFRLGDEITVHKLTSGIIAKLLILTVPFTLALMANGVDVELVSLISWSIGVLIMSEGFNTIGNTYSALTKERVKQIDGLSLIIKTLAKTIEKYLNKYDR